MIGTNKALDIDHIAYGTGEIISQLSPRKCLKNSIYRSRIEIPESIYEKRKKNYA